MSRIFISHSSKDREIVNVFVDHILRLGMSFPKEEIFCTSSDGLSISSGEDWRNAIKHEIVNADMIILIISPNYKASEVCLNEMGAAWITEAKVIPLIVGDVTYRSAGVIVEPTQIEKLDDRGLDKLCEEIKTTFPEIASKVDIPIWNSKKRKFLRVMDDCIKKNPFHKAYSQNEIIKLVKELHDTQEKMDELLEKNELLVNEIEEIKKCKNLEEVINVERKYESNDTIEEFAGLTKIVRKKLEQVNASVRTVIYNKRYNKSLGFTMEHRNELVEAEAKGLIDFDGEEYFPLYDKQIMKEIKLALDELEKFLQELNYEDVEKLEQEYDNLNVNDLDFWKEIIGISLSYSY